MRVTLPAPAFVAAACVRINRRLGVVAPVIERARTDAGPAMDMLQRRARPLWASTTPLGRGVAFVGVAAWIAAAQLGWLELRYIAVAALAVLVLAGAFVLGRSIVDVQLDVQPDRVFVGVPVGGELRLRNASRRRLLPSEIDLPVGTGTARFSVPSLAGDETHEELFVVPTHRRAVIKVGPASAVRTDPLGLLRREAVSQVSKEIFVHPTICSLDSFAAGLLRDLEGRTTRDISTNDLAFHALREYVPGDDRRYIHWRSSAKADKLLVRQFLDTRRSTLAVVVDGSSASYTQDDDVETAMSVAGSIVVRAVQDELDVALIAAGQTVTNGSGRRYLDALSRAEIGEGGRALPAQTRVAARLAPDTSLALLITGDVIGFPELRGAARAFGPHAGVLVIRVERSAPVGLSRSGGLTVLGVRDLSDLPRLLASGVAA